MRSVANMNGIKRTGVIREYDLRSTSVKIGLVFIYLACAVILVVSVFPIIWVFLAGFKELKEFYGTMQFLGNKSFIPKAFNIDYYIETWKDMKFHKYYINSLWSVAGSILSALIFNGLLAYGLSILKPKGHKFIYSLVMFSLLIPATTFITPLFANLTRLKMTGFFTPLWLAAGANAFYVVLFKQFFDAFPMTMIEAGRIDGCGPLQVFSRIVLPLSKPILVVVAIYTINGAWSDFLLPYLVLDNNYRTVMVKLFEYKGANNTNDLDVLRAVVFSILPPIILFFFFQKKLTENIMTSGIKG
jgi:multiple sugar transport system permease protein